MINYDTALTSLATNPLCEAANSRVVQPIIKG